MVKLQSFLLGRLFSGVKCGPFQGEDFPLISHNGPAVANVFLLYYLDLARRLQGVSFLNAFASDEDRQRFQVNGQLVGKRNRNPVQLHLRGGNFLKKTCLEKRGS